MPSPPPPPHPHPPPRRHHIQSRLHDARSSMVPFTNSSDHHGINDNQQRTMKVVQLARYPVKGLAPDLVQKSGFLKF